MADNDFIERKLRQAWRQERRFYHLRGLSRMILWLIVLLAVDFLIDWGIFFNSRIAVRIGFLLLVANAAVLVWAVWHEWLQYLRPYQPLLMALDVESRHPELSSLLVSYTQSQSLLENQPNVSPELIDAMRDQAIDVTRPLDFRKIVDFGQLKRLLIVTLGMLVFFAALSVSWPQHLGILFQRLAGAETNYPTRTRIDEVRHDVAIRLGDSAVVTAATAGVIPAAGRIYTKPADDSAGWKSLPLAKSPNQPEFSRELKALRGDTLFYVRIGDAQTEPARIRVVSAPKIAAAKLTLRYPAYMNQPDGQSDQLNLDVPEGTQVSWELTCEPAVKRVEVQVDDGRQVAAKVSDDGTRATFQTKADRGLKYTFRWTVEDAEQQLEFDDVEYRIRVVPDLLPEVELVTPRRNGLATVKKQLKLAVRAGDDHGLAKAWLVYSLNDSQEQRLPIRDFRGVPSEQFTYQWNLLESLPDLEANKEVTFRIEVVDLHPEADRRVRRSVTRRVRIVDPAVYLQWYRAELAAQRDQIRRARDAEQESSQKVKQVKRQEGAQP